MTIQSPGLTPAGVLDKLAAIRMAGVGIPMDGRWLVSPRHTQREEGVLGQAGSSPHDSALPTAATNQGLASPSAVCANSPPTGRQVASWRRRRRYQARKKNDEPHCSRGIKVHSSQPSQRSGPSALLQVGDNRVKRSEEHRGHSRALFRCRQRGSTRRRRPTAPFLSSASNDQKGLGNFPDRCFQDVWCCDDFAPAIGNG
jgi:hypothetical protein